jgi:hypothetical protein
MRTRGQPRCLNDSSVKMIRWLINNTKLCHKEISRYIESEYDIRVSYCIVDSIKKNIGYKDIEGEIDINSPNLQKYISLCYPDTFMNCNMTYTTGGGPHKKASYTLDGPISSTMMNKYIKAKEEGLVS